MGEQVAERAPELAAVVALQRRLGAVWGEEGGARLPLHYGDPGAELEAATAGTALVDLSWTSRLELRGSDRARFLNGLVTASTADLEPGCGVHALVTTQQGKVLAETYVTALEDRHWLELPAGRGDAVRQHLEKYRVVEDVEVASLSDRSPMALLGPGADHWLAARCEPPDEDRHLRVHLVDHELELAHRRLFGVDAFVLWPPVSQAEETLASLLAEPDLRVVGVEALETLRIEAGRGRWGVDFDDQNVANETGLLDETVDFEKGCYLGQEIVARIRYRGRPSELCCPLAVSEVDEPPSPGLEIRAAGESVGILTSVARRRRDGDWPALGRLATKALEGDQELTLAGGASVRLRASGSS